MPVVDELDALKRSSTTPSGSKKSLRTLAQDALRFLEEKITDPDAWTTLVEGATSPGARTGSTFLTVAREEVGHVPIPHADSEIVDRALALTPLASDLYLVSNDTGMLFRGRKAGLKTHRHADDLKTDYGVPPATYGQATA